MQRNFMRRREHDDEEARLKDLPMDGSQSLGPCARGGADGLGSEGLGAFPNPDDTGWMTAIEARTCWDKTMTLVVRRKLDRCQDASLHGASDAVFAQTGKAVRYPKSLVLSASAPVPETQAPKVQEALDALAEALTIARAITDNQNRAFALVKIAGALGKAGDTRGVIRIFPEALAAARGILDDPQRNKALYSIAPVQAKAGDLPGAIATVRSISNEIMRSRAISYIAEARAKVGDFGGALAIARSMPHDGQRARAFGGIAAAQARAGDIGGALATARSLPYDLARAVALISIAEAQVEAARQD